MAAVREQIWCVFHHLAANENEINLVVHAHFTVVFVYLCVSRVCTVQCAFTGRITCRLIGLFTQDALISSLLVLCTLHTAQSTVYTHYATYERHAHNYTANSKHCETICVHTMK